MKAGTKIKLPDGRIGTVVYNGIDGIGIKWGEHNIKEIDIHGSGGLINEEIPGDYAYFADAMLRDKYPDADIECVGGDYEIIKDK